MNSRSVAGPMGQMNHWPIVWCSKYYFFSQFLAKILCKNPFIFFCNFTKIKIKPLFYFQSIKMILGPSDAWSMRRLTQQPSVLYWRLSDFNCIECRAVRAGCGGSAMALLVFGRLEQIMQITLLLQEHKLFKLARPNHTTAQQEHLELLDVSNNQNYLFT